MGEHINFKTDKGEIKTILAMDELEIDSIDDSMDMNSEISETIQDKLMEYCKENKLKVGFIVSLEVFEGNKGKGVGRNLMEKFQEKIMSKTDIDILVARTNNKQSKGFVLEEFYEKYGFKGIELEYGDMLMVSKGHENILDTVLGLKERRKIILNHFYENGCPLESENVKTFLEKRESESKLNVTTSCVKSRKVNKRNKKPSH